jgi:hypothetical protein
VGSVLSKESSDVFAIFVECDTQRIDTEFIDGVYVRTI